MNCLYKHIQICNILIIWLASMFVRPLLYVEHTHWLMIQCLVSHQKHAERSWRLCGYGWGRGLGKENSCSSVVMMKYSDATNLRPCADVCLNILDPSLLLWHHEVLPWQVAVVFYFFSQSWPPVMYQISYVCQFYNPEVDVLSPLPTLISWCGSEQKRR